MGFFTATIFVERMEGIQLPPHMLFLWENGSASWSLVPVDIFEQGIHQKRINWIPTADHALEDAILMIMVHFLKEKKIFDLTSKWIKKDLKKQIILSDDIDLEDLNELRVKCRDIKTHYRMIISVFDNSLIENQFPILKKYKGLEYIVCKPSEKPFHNKK